jgi:hypothetical protein
MYVSTWSQDKGGEGVHGGNKCQWTFVHEQKDALDVLMSSSDPEALVVIDERDSELVHPIGRGPCSENGDTEMNLMRLREVPDLKNNQTCCSMKEKVSKRHVAPPAQPPVIQTNCIPDAPKPAHSKTGIESPDGPKKAVPSIHLRFCKESPCRCLDDLRMGPTVEHDDDAVGHRPVHRKRNAHHKDVCVGSANALTQC